MAVIHDLDPAMADFPRPLEAYKHPRGISIIGVLHQFDDSHSLTADEFIADAPKYLRTWSKPTRPVSRAVSRWHIVTSLHPATRGCDAKREPLEAVVYRRYRVAV
jgi:hypothetical protein